jgi:hypothetical protein
MNNAGEDLVKTVREIMKEEYETRIKELETEIIDLELMVSELKNRAEKAEAISAEAQLLMRTR